MPDTDLPSQEAEQPQQEAITPQEPNEPASPTPQESQEPEPQTPQEPQPEPAPDDHWRRRATEQGQENILLNHRVQDNEKARRELTKEPTESELQAAFPEWYDMTPTEQMLAKKSLVSERRTEALLLKERDREAVAQWDTDLELAIAKNPTLQGKEQAFKAFATKPSRRGIDVDVLISAFLYDPGPSASQAPSSTPKPALEGGNGGPRGPISSKKKYSAEEMQTIQASDPRKYREMLLHGDFDD